MVLHNMKIQSTYKIIRKQVGLSLLEILITVLIMAVGSLGIAALQLTGLKYATGSYGRTQATLLAGDMLDKIRANREYAKNGGGNYVISNFTDSATSSSDCTSTVCTPGQLADFDASNWIQNVSRLLVSGKGKIVLDSSTGVTGETIAEISIQWRKSATKENSQQSVNAEELEIITFRSAI